MTQRELVCLQNKMYDIVVVGAGPAGLMAARSLKNVNFICIDSKKEIGLPLRCGEGIREKEFLQFFKHKNYDFVKNTVKGHKLVYEDLERTIRVNLLELDRPKFEQFLAKPVRKRIKLNTNCKDIKIKRDYAEIKTNKGIIRAKLIILANGANYKEQKKLKLIEKDPDMLVCYGGIYKIRNIDKGKFYYFCERKKKGCLWIFPKSEKLANIGFGALNDRNPKKTLSSLLKKHDIDAKQISEYAGVVSVSGPIKKTYSGRILVCGTAAGFVYAGTGEGIQFALESGKIVGKIAMEAITKGDFSENFLRKYELEWKKVFGDSMKAGIIFKDILYLAVRKNITRALFNIPTEKELKSMVLEGKIPLRAKILWRLFGGPFS